ncbi:MAG: YncE family protein [Gemmatimonadales bacterium]
MGGFRALALALWAAVLPARARATAHDSTPVTRVLLAGRPYGGAISAAGVAYITLVQAARLGRTNLPTRSFGTTVPVGSVPTEIAFNSTGTWAYVTNQFSQNVGVVNVATNTQIDVIPVRGDPFEVVVALGDVLSSAPHRQRSRGERHPIVREHLAGRHGGQVQSSYAHGRPHVRGRRDSPEARLLRLPRHTLHRERGRLRAVLGSRLRHPDRPQPHPARRRRVRDRPESGRWAAVRQHSIHRQRAHSRGRPAYPDG